MSLPFDKRTIRKTLLWKRERLDGRVAECLSAAAQTRLLGLATFHEAETLALYSPIRNEVATDNLQAAALAAGKRVCYPRVFGDELRFFQIDHPGDLRTGSFGIGEPGRQSGEVGLAQIELLLIPGVAFDQHGFRLGYGRGYFDRLLAGAGFDGTRIGFGYEFQILDQLPNEKYDQRVDLLVTDERIFSPSQV